jgi:DNA invertase Pin-like site-specific DNA recombinase
MKLGEYTRVSGRGQVRDGYGLAIQHKDCQGWAKQAGHRIVLHCTDNGLSGTLGSDVVEGIGTNGEHLADRPGLQELIAAVQDGAIGGVIVGKLDRLGRATHVQEAVLAMIWRAGGKVFAADQGEVLADDPDDPMRTAMRKIMAVFDELDKAIAVQRMRKGRQAKAAAGKHAVGIYPFGTKPGGEGRERDAVPDEAEQRAVARILELHQAGQSYRQIITAIEAEGIRPRTAQHWSPSTIRKIVLRAGSR